jgi:hypothetical protein
MILSAPIKDVPTLPTNVPVGFYEKKAREMAVMVTLGIDTPMAIGQYHGLSVEQTRYLLSTNYFKGLLAEAQEELKDSNTVLERARCMARMASPEAVTTLLNLSRNCDDARVSKDAAETILNLAGLATKSPVPASSIAGQSGISINIGFTAALPAPQHPQAPIDVTPTISYAPSIDPDP